MRVSVVIPAHNAEATIRAALASVAAQTVAPAEIVVVDDGSTDATAEAVAASGVPVRLLHQERGGPSAARNAGIAASTGELVAFLDADDEWHPEKLERQLALVAGERTVAVATDWSRERRTDPAPQEVPVSTVTSDALLILNRFQTSTVLARRAALEAAGGFDPSLDGVEDWDMWLRLSEIGTVEKLDWPFVRYNDSPLGVSKALERVYTTGATMLGRRFGERPDRWQRTVLAWHHLRFALAFSLIGERAQAARCLHRSLRPDLRGAVPPAAIRLLAPFLGRRIWRRVPARFRG